MGNFEAGSEIVYKVYTGLADMHVIAVNPTKEQLNKLGVNIQSEPNYTSKSEDGNDMCRVDFWLHEPKLDIKTKVSFFVENKLHMISQAGNMQFINDFGQSTWAKSIEDLKEKKYEWFKLETARPAIPGEVGVIDFISSWLSIGRDKVAKIEDVVALSKGNVAELRPLIDKHSDRRVQVLLGSREGYQAVYNRFFSRAGNRRLDYWTKNLENSQFNYQNTFALKELGISGVEESSESSSTNNPWGELKN